MQVEIWSDVVCPWCYLGKRHFEQALGEFEHRDEVSVIHRSFQLDPTAPTDRTVATVDLLASKYGLSEDQATAAQLQMEQRAAADGLEYHLDGLHSGNTYDAHRLLQLARERGRQDALVERLYRAYFTERRSVFDHASLTEFGVDAGLDADEVRRVLASDDFADAVDEDIAEARALGANGVPFFVIDRRFGISGAQPAELIAQTLERAWADAAVAG